MKPPAQRVDASAIAVFSLIIIALCASAFLRCGVWQDDIGLWSDAISKAPRKARLHENLGVAFAKKGYYDRALQEYQTALSIDPKFASAHQSLGFYYLDLGKPDDAAREFEIAVKLSPKTYPVLFFILGGYYADQGRIPDALAAFQAYVYLRPRDAIGHHRMGVLFEKQNKLLLAIRSYEQAVNLNPRFAAAAADLARLRSIDAVH